MTSGASDILLGAREALAFVEGEAAPATVEVHVPADVDVRATRVATGMTRAALAAACGVPAGTLRDWKQGSTRPGTAAGSHLLINRHRPDVVPEAPAAAA